MSQDAVGAGRHTFRSSDSVRGLGASRSIAAGAFATTMGYEVGQNVVIYPGTVIGDGCTIGDNAVVGKPPVLSARSTAKREDLPPLEIGPNTTISTGAVVFAGTTIGANVIVGDLASVRERCAVGDDVVLGRGVFVENDSSVGARTKIQAHSYVTAYSTLEEDVFLACAVATTNDNYMGRTEERFAQVKGPTIKRGARVGGGVVLCPAVVVGEEAYIGAGAVVIDDVPSRAVVVGNPARVIREVPDRELLDRDEAIRTHPPPTEPAGRDEAGFPAHRR